MAYSYNTQKWWQKLLGSTILGNADYYFNANSNEDAVKRALMPQWLYNATQPQLSKTDLNTDIISALESEGLDFANLSQSQIENLLNKYWEEDEGMWSTEHTFDYDRFLSDYNAMNAALDERPEAPSWDDALEKAYRDRDASLAELDELRQMQVGNFNDELQSLASGYNTSRAAVLSNQYRQNAQLMDTMVSQMDRQNRNALEAGASAGLRLAGNINTLLSTQNQQSQTSLETANQLAQMMVNQRNAEASVRGRYGDYMIQHFATKQDKQDSALDKAKDYYDVSEKSYSQKINDWDDAQGGNPLWDYRGTLGKSKYNKTGG